MPIFEYNGKKYNVREEHIDSFMKDFPDASTIMEREGKKYRVKSADYKTFMSEQQQPEQTAPDSTPETPVISTAKEKPLTEQDKIRFSANMGQMKRHTEQMLDGFSEQMETMREYQENAPLGGGQTAEGKIQFNPESGKLEKTYITPLGNRYTSKGLADMESFRYRQAADMSVSGQLRRARLKLAELQEKRDASANRVHEQWEEDTKKNTAPLGFLLAADTYVPRQMSDRENSTLDVAIRQTEELIKDLEEQKDREQGVDVGFWRGFGRVAGDFRTWDFGMSDMRDALTMMNADDLKGENATDGEREAYNEMMGALYNKGQAEQMYGGNAGFWNRAGMMTGHMPAFMLDFGITGGGFNGINVLSKAGTKAATKVVGKEVVEQLAEQGFKTYLKNNGVKGLGQYATNWTIKALGTTADDLLLRAPLMTNTVQAGKTTADIIDRKLGDVVVDENGNYDFSNDKTWGNAIWQGEANAIVENYSEMFGSHLDPVVTLGNMSKLANVVGAKRIGAVLSKADAGALNGIMGQTHQLFNKMGVSDYFGEVTEEYYGQLWRTMLNLDDAYQQNPDGTRTNLLATGQFHGDIWGGMALSMGLMGAGKATLSGAQYASMKHGVNKADARATELLGKEIWEPLRTTIDLTTNDDIGSVAGGIVNDKNFSDDERAAILTYMERSLMMRGFNLSTLAQKRGRRQDEDVQSLDESYIDGYNIADPQEMTDAKNMRDYQLQRVSAIVDENTLGFLDAHPLNALEEMRSNGIWGESELETVLDYLNAKQVYEGMIQRVRDDIDARVEQSNAMVDARTNRTTGMIQGATMKLDDRRVYVVSGNLVPYADGSGIDNKASDGSIIVRDAETGALEQVSPDAVLNIDEPLNPSDEKMTAEEAIIQQFAQEASDKIDGVVTFNPGDTYTITGDDAQIQVQIVANEDGIVDNGDGTVNVSDGVNIFPLAKETIQQQADAANLARVVQFEQQRTIENAERKQEMQEAERPQYALNDIVSLTDENGVTVRGNITADADADGRYEVFTEAPINGKRVSLFTRDELDNMLLEHNGVAFEHPAENENNNGVENIPENDNNAHQNIGSADLAIPAMQRIPKDEQGNPLYEQADSDTAWDAIVEQTEGDETMAQTVADGMVADKEAALKKLEKTKSKGGNSIAEKIASEKERKAAIDAVKAEFDIWKKIAGTANRRKMDADAERRRIANEAAALRKAEEEKLRTEREEAERIEREALNGVPDMVDDKPQDARARGYRRMNGHKIDRQEPVQALMGKEVSVKFSDDAIVGGRISVIDANLLQPSHVQGVRNPLHFIDEAQPKERNDEASVLSARKIAGNIRPEEITSSVTAYTGAPTINARGEVIQGNNRSDALRQMWEGHKDQAEQYKQYLKDHADEFGLRAEDIDSVERPVLVNMLEVDDTEAINLGQFVAQDTESGGIERIKPKNIMQKMGNDMRSFANLLLASSDEETSFAGLVDANGTNVLKWMMQKGYITPTQYSSAFDSKGNLTAEAKNDLRGIMYQSIFKGGSVRLEEMFNALSVKAQKAILATAFRDYDSPNAERMVEEIQNSIRAYYALSQDKQFTEAKNFKEARIAVESWKHQYQIDDATGESYLPADNFSNFALLLATIYKGENQGIIQNTFNKIYDLIQGTQEATLFEQPDNTPRTLTQAIYETLNIIYDGQQRSNVLVGDTATSQRGQQGSNGTLAPRERVENRNGTTDDTGRTESIGGRSGVESEDRGNKEEENDETEVIGRSMTADEAQDFIADMELSAEIAPEIDLTIENWDALFGEDGIVSTPIGNVKMGENQFTKLMRQGRNGKLGMIKPTLEHPHAIVSDVSEAKEGDTTERASSYVFIRSFKKADGSRYYYFTSITVSKDGKEVVVSNQEKRRNAIANLLTKGKMVWKHADDVSDASDMAQGLYSPQGNVSDLATEGTDAPQTTMLSDNKGTNNSRKSSELGEKIAKAEAEVDVNPTDKQKEAGNYKKGHVQVGVFDITIEQPKGSVRSGVDANGNKWETTMQNTYGYIRGTEGVDGDHIDVFLSDDIDGWNGSRVFVVDQYNEDGSFDEHKVMLGFNETDDAEAAYFANYDNDWAKKHKTVVTGVNLEDFEKWIDSSHRKTKAFAEYKSVKSVEEQSSSTQVNRLSEIKSRIEELHKEQEAAHGQSDIFEEARIISEINDLFTEQRKLEQNNSNEETTTPTDAAYTITQAQYTTKRGKVLDMHLVKFNDELRDTVRKHTTMFAKQLKGWWDKEKQGFMMRSKEDAERLAEYATDAQSQQPVSMSDMQALNDGNVQFVEPQLSETSKPEERQEYTPVWQYSVSVDKETGLTTLRRDDVSGPIPIGDGRFNYTANSPEEMLEIVRNPKNFNQELRDAVETILENKVKIREIVRTEKAATTEQESKPENNTSGNRLVTDERYAELRERMRKKLLGQMNMGIDPEILAIGTEMSVYHLEKGARKFAEYATAMIADLGDAIRPYLKAFYNGARDFTSNVITGKDFAERLEAAERSKKHNEAELKELLSREGKPFEYEEELAQAKSQLEEYAELMKKELEEKEAKYAEMDATVETANNVSVSEEDDELKREGDGAYTDDEVSFENDPVAKLLGRPRRTAKQRREFAQRERQRMAERVERLAEKLHLDNVEVVTDASVLEGKKQRAKGFYSKSTGKITIVIPNHTSTFDVEQTLLHEAVAHYGLRQLFGEHFGTFLDNVFNNADENIRRRIVDMAAKNGWDFHKATEEYLASLAEDTEFENINASWWRQIKDFFLNMLHKIGFEDFRGVTLSDNELRYILWRSYENLAEPGRYRSILGEASDVAKQYELKVGNYAVADPHRQTVAENDDALYRDGDPERHERELARDRYERRVKSGMFQSQEALQDSMLGLKEAMTAILGKETNIEDVDGFENAYLGENRLSSVNKAEADAFAHTLFKPMLDEVAKLARTEAEREELTDYMMAKHGLERNIYMRNEAINNGATDADQTDYAGLTALTGMDNIADAEAEAQLMIDDYEQAHDTTNLWEKVNAVSKAILSKSYECGMMSKATFDKISGMYDFYIPLRGFDEKTSSEAYAYLTHKQSAFNAPIKKAEGRRSKADDPFANLQSMVEGAIMQGNRNKLVKQRFLNFALNHPSDLVSVSDIWIEYDAVTDEWKPVFPDNIDSTDTPEEVEQKMQDFETKMEQLAQQYPDQYKHGKDTVNIPYRIVESGDMRQHQIVVKRGGRDYVITINGNPRAAQALNGQTNPDNDMSGAIGAILRAGENINRQLSAFYTTRNPDFIVSNFMRDMLYTNTMTWIRESPNYALRFHRNYMYANPVRIKQLLAKHRKGTLDMGNRTEAMFHQFMMNGGETGYANIRDIEQHKNDIRRELKKSNGKIPVKKAWDLLGERFDEYNRAVENCARFAAFMTSREMGRSIDRAIYDAKEISVNFNKKGSGAKFYDSTGQTKTGNASALVSGLGRSGYVFWNAAIQGTANFGRQMKRHPAKAFTGIAAMFLLGAIVAYLGGDDDDDDDKNAYYNLPEYVRRSNILFRAGDSWVSIPLPVEYRAVYGMGELMISVLNGKKHLTGGEIAESIAGQATQILPIDFLEGGGGLNAFVPSAYKPLWEAYVAEKSWTGMPLYKDTPWNKDMPEWTKAYKSANKYIVGLANVMNEATGGDPYTKGAIDLNPAKIEYMLNGYFGGVFGTIDKLSKTAETVSGNREYDPRSFLLVNRLVKAGDERTEYRAVNNEYFRLKEEHDRLKSRLKHYEEDTDNDIFDYAEKIDFLYNSPEYERYEIFEDYHEDIDDLYNELKEAISDEERKDIEAELNEVKKEMIDEINLTRKRK